MIRSVRVSNIFGNYRTLNLSLDKLNALRHRYKTLKFVETGKFFKSDLFKSSGDEIDGAITVLKGV